MVCSHYGAGAGTTYASQSSLPGEMLPGEITEARVRYHARVLYPMTIRVGVRVPFLGRKHFVMEYLALGDDEMPLVSGETTLVMYDYAAGRTKPMAEEIRAAIESWEGVGG